VRRAFIYSFISQFLHFFSIFSFLISISHVSAVGLGICMPGFGFTVREVSDGVCALVGTSIAVCALVGAVAPVCALIGATILSRFCSYSHSFQLNQFVVSCYLILRFAHTH
jgi:tetrahydromethanopterin S-methyltransferase subunit C